MWLGVWEGWQGRIKQGRESEGKENGDRKPQWLSMRREVLVSVNMATSLDTHPLT
jgi:hypothetical protein